MSKETFFYNKEYEFIGYFWLPDNKDKQLSGKVTYSKDEGVKFILIDNDLTKDEYKETWNNRENETSKYIYGEVYCNDSYYRITLINAYYGNGISGDARNSLKITNGNSMYLVIGEHVKSENLSLVVTYDDYFNKMILPRFSVKKRLINLITSGDSIKLNNDVCLNLLNDHGGYFTTEETFSDIFRSFRQNKKFKQDLETAINPLFKKYKHDIFLMAGHSISLEISHKSYGLLTLLEEERKIRQLFEIIINHPIQIISLRLKDPELCDCYVLGGYSSKEVKWNSENYIPPILYKDFGNYKNSQIKIKDMINSWLDLYNNTDSRPFLLYLHDIIRENNIIRRGEFASAIFEMEYFVKEIACLESTRSDRAKVFIDNYANPEWINNVKSIHPLDSYNLDKIYYELRGIVAHPSSINNIDKSDFKPIVLDNILLQKYYAYLSGLLLKAFLQHISDLDTECLDKYLKDVIETRIYSNIDY